VNNLKEHSIFKTIAFILALSVLVPTATKFAHIFANHKHDICKGEKATHLHEINTDCDFYKFKLNNHYYFSLVNNDLFQIASYYKIPVLTYKFLNNHRPLSFSLRGPPALV
jgi:hypothetical protein